MFSERLVSFHGHGASFLDKLICHPYSLKSLFKLACHHFSATSSCFLLPGMSRFLLTGRLLLLRKTMQSCSCNYWVLKQRTDYSNVKLSSPRSLLYIIYT